MLHVTAQNLCDFVRCPECEWAGRVSQTISYGDAVIRCPICAALAEEVADPPAIFVESPARKEGDP